MRWPLVALVVLVVLHAVSSHCEAQQPAQPPKSRADIVKDFAEKQRKLDDTLDEMKKKHSKAVKEAEAEAVKKLKTIAQSEAGKGEIAEATQTWTSVLEIDASDIEAKKFFRSIGRLDIVQQQLEKASQREVVFPKRRTEWQGENGINFRLLPDGTWFESWATKERQRVHREVSRSPYHVELFNRNGSSRVQHILYPDHFYWKAYLDKEWNLGEDGAWIE